MAVQGTSVEALPPRQRFICVADDWMPTREEWGKALALIETPDDVARILRYHKGAATPLGYPHHTERDPKCFALCRLLLQMLGRAAVGDAARYANHYKWVRTLEGRPHLVLRCDSGGGGGGRGQSGGALPPLWNVNGSHAGGVVAVATEPDHVVGVDVMPVELVPEGTQISDATVAEFFAHFETFFTCEEWEWIRLPVPEEEECAPFISVKRFMTLWTLKEAYIKAVGIGLGFELRRASFVLSRSDVWSPDYFHQIASNPKASASEATHDPTARAVAAAASVTLMLDGCCATPARWRFTLHECRRANVVVAVAVGHPSEARGSSFIQVLASAPSGALLQPLRREEQHCPFPDDDAAFVSLAAEEVIESFLK